MTVAGQDSAVGISGQESGATRPAEGCGCLLSDRPGDVRYQPQPGAAGPEPSETRLNLIHEFAERCVGGPNLADHSGVESAQATRMTPMAPLRRGPARQVEGTYLNP